MAEYIKRADAIKIAERYGTTNGSALGRHSGVADCIASEISDMPATDVVPVVHGRWINPKRGFWLVSQCSACEAWHPTTGDGPKYCPNCGAKMDGGTT